MRCCLLCLSLLFVGSSLSFARDIYVNNQSGNDTFDGLREVGVSPYVGPVKSINLGLHLARPGDRVILANTGMPYHEEVSVQGGRNSGVHGGYPVIIEGNGSVLDGQAPVEDRLWESLGDGVFRAPCRIQSFQSLFLAGQPAERVPLDAKANHKPKLEPQQYFLWEGYLFLRVPNDSTPYQSQVTCAQLRTGITLYDVRNLIIRNLTVQGFAQDGVNAHDNAFDVKLESVVSRHNGRSGFSIGGASRVSLTGCSAAGNFAAQLRTEGYSTVQLAECKWDEEIAPGVVHEGGRVVEAAGGK